MTNRLVWLVPLALFACGGSDNNSQPDGNTGSGGSPTATATATPTSGTAPLEVALDCEGAGGDAPLSYVWDFGDGTQSTLQKPSHTYTAAGMYTAMCEVKDANGDSATASVMIDVDAAMHTPHGQIDVLNTTHPTCAVSAQTLVELSSAASTDPDNDTLWYEWALISQPAGSTAQLSSNVGTSPTFRPDIDGTYVVRLHVQDPSGLSDNVDLTVTSESPSQIVTVSGDNQMAAGSTTLPDAVVVAVETACGLPVAGQTVLFSTANGSVSPSSAVTDASGNAETTVTAGCSLGSSSVSATLASASSVSDTIAFSSELGTAYAIVLSKPANAQVPGPMTVRAEVHDHCGNLETGDNATAFTLSLSEATSDASASFTAVTTGTAVDTTNPHAWIVKVAGGVVVVTLGDTAAETITFLMADSQSTGLQFIGGGGTGFDQTVSNVGVSCNGGVVTVSFPTAPAPLGNGTLTVFGTVDSDTTDEYVSVYGESTGGTLLANMFGRGVSDCAFQSQQATVSQSLLQSFAADGTITLQLQTGPGLDCFCGPDQVSVELSYPSGTTADFTP
jgi:PKD repeat protein